MTEAEKRMLSGVSATQMSGYSRFVPTLLSKITPKTNSNNSPLKGTEGEERKFDDGYIRVFRDGGWRLKDGFNRSDIKPVETPVETPVVEEGGGEVEGEVTGGLLDDLKPSSTRTYLKTTPTPTAPSTNITDFFSEATTNFRNIYGDDPNFKQLEMNYLRAIRSAYDEIVGEGGTLDQAREIADQQFGIARGETQRGFRESRQQLAEQAYLGERQMQQQLAERGLGGSGLAQLGKVQQRIAQGDAVSDLYRDFAESVQQLSLQEAQTELSFAQAEADLNLALTRDIQQMSDRFRQERQQYNQWKGNTITGLAEALRTGNMQQYQIQLDEWNRGLSVAERIDQEAKESAQNQLDLTSEAYRVLIAEVERDPNLDDEEKAAKISEYERKMLIEMDAISAAVGYSPGNIASSILGANAGVLSSGGNTLAGNLGGFIGGPDWRTQINENLAATREEIAARRESGLINQFRNVNWFGLNPQQ